MSQLHGFHEIVVSVFDIDRIAGPLVELGGWERRTLPDAPLEQHGFWGLPETCDRIEQALVIAPGSEQGALRLVKFHGVPDQKLMRPAQHSWDTGGIFDIDVYVDDIEMVYQGLLRCGWTAFGPPTDYSWGGFDVAEALMIGPDGLIVGLLKAYGKVLIDLPPIIGMSRAFNSAQVVADYDVGMDFFVRKLGWQALVDSEIVGVEEPGRNVMGIPRPLATTTRRRASILHPSGPHEGSIELIEMRELEGHDYSANCRAPNIGYLCYRFPVDDARSYRDEIAARGVAILREPQEIEISPVGKVFCFSIQTPDGAILEFVEFGNM